MAQVCGTNKLHTRVTTGLKSIFTFPKKSLGSNRNPILRLCEEVILFRHFKAMQGNSVKRL